MTQELIVLEHLLQYNEITSMECYDRYRITDLQHAIMLLRKKGYKILDTWQSCVNSFGVKCKYKRYYLEKEEN